MELISTGIFINAVKVGPDVRVGDIDLSHIFNHDETPQFINYGVDRIPSGLEYAGCGEACKLLKKENRESVTIHPMVPLQVQLLLYLFMYYTAFAINMHAVKRKANMTHFKLILYR